MHRSKAVVPWFAAVLVVSSTAARASDFSFKLEPGVAIPLSAPQSDIYGVGGSQSVKALFGITPWLDVGPAASFVLLPASASGGASGSAWSLGGGVRFKRPHDATDFYGVSPWADVDALYVRTGVLNRPGFDLAVGLAVPIDDDRRFWVGPFVRYAQTLQPDHAGYDNRDAKILSVGLSFEVGSGLEHPRSDSASQEPRVVTRDVVSCPDRDQDGVPDSVDHCPDVAGTAENFGCPNYKKIIVKKDKLELKEKLYFAWNDSKLEEASYPVLDEVVQALKDNPGFRVQVEGHTDSSGADDHNQTLSERRATTVLDYLEAHGIAKDRLASKGFSSSVPLDTNATAAGRENNRRVEFVVHFIILNSGSSK